ncbi:PAS domain-containing sensor histidine kinase [Dyadobacter sp. CY326]|uniref:PAS domain-containing sensor histidine kinase n=1 Tax=Dyadobacter sp. CY326 TaxID=2907300 RepID=UPI001F281A06|nr:PAS domain-containing sensor histidine kinase [Dyadobacter sp. CY326]MCE7065963.1 ATP-binding protein [Dyadobacter sp. CY326]
MIDTFRDNKDLTENSLSEQARLENEANLQFALTAAQLGTWNLDPATGIISFDERCRQLYGNPPEAILQYETIIQHIHIEDRDKVVTAIQNALDPEKSSVYDMRYRTIGATDKVLRWLHCVGKAYFGEDGQPYRFAGVSRNITEEVAGKERIAQANEQAAAHRIESENRLRVSEEHLRTLIEQAPVATSMFVGKDMIIELPNEAMLKIWGKGDSVIGKPLREALPELESQPFLQILDRIYETGEPYAAFGSQADLMINGALETFYFDFTFKPLRNSSGEIYAILDMAVDVTEQVKSRRALEKSEERYRQLANDLELRVQKRTEELHQANQELINSNSNLQQFAYAASHDMQEPLRKIQSFSSRLQTVYAKALDDNGIFMLNRIQDASKRMSSMIDDLLAYSRLTTRDSAFEEVKLDKIVAGVIADLEFSIEEQKSEIKVGPLPTVWGNPAQLTQLIQNLLSNAIKYRKQDVHSVIEIQGSDLDDDELANMPRLLPNHAYSCLEVRDNGIGFDEKYLDRIFQMFQRLHGRGEFSGSGIGLSLCKKVVQNHHGHITAKSEPNQGSTFIVYLPKPL